jgi:hypothetical protein
MSPFNTVIHNGEARSIHLSIRKAPMSADLTSTVTDTASGTEDVCSHEMQTSGHVSPV